MSYAKAPDRTIKWCFADIRFWNFLKWEWSWLYYELYEIHSISGFRCLITVIESAIINNSMSYFCLVFLSVLSLNPCQFSGAQQQFHRSTTHCSKNSVFLIVAFSASSDVIVLANVQIINLYPHSHHVSSSDKLPLYVNVFPFLKSSSIVACLSALWYESSLLTISELFSNSAMYYLRWWL